VTQLGYSDELGTVMYGENQEEVFLGMSMQKSNNISEATAQKIDAEVRRFVAQGYEDARKILTDRRDALEAIAQGLLEYETLTGAECNALLRGEKIVRKTDDEDRGPAGPAVPVTGKARPRDEPGLGNLAPQT
jgi:cell division protease FtsH